VSAPPPKPPPDGAGPPIPPGSPPPKKKAKRFNGLTKVFGFLAALFALIAAILGLFVNNKSQQNQTLTVNLEQANSAKTSAQQSVSAAQSTISSLQSQLAAPSASPSATAAPTVRNQGIVSIAAGQSFSFDGTGKTWSDPNHNYDVIYSSPGRLVLEGSTAVIIPSQATYDSCQTTGYGSPEISIAANTQPGTNICLKTGEKRFVALKLQSISQNVITFDAVSYDPPASQ
jgi:hypothetical protein